MSEVFAKLDPLIMGTIISKQKNQKKQNKKNSAQRKDEKRRNDELVNAQGRSLLGSSSSILSGRPESATAGTLLGG